MTQICVCCGRPTPDGYACHRCALDRAESLREAAGHAEDAQTVIARQARYGGGGRTTDDRPLPPNFAASAELANAENTITTWARHVIEQGGDKPSAWRQPVGPLCAYALTECGHLSCRTILRRPQASTLGEITLWLAGQVEWLRKRPEAAEAFDELHDACGILRRLVDRPATDDRLVGMCDCGRTLYARHGRDVVQCRASNCGATWNVDESQAILRAHLDEKLVTASEAARLAQYLDTDRTQQQIRRFINVWAGRGQLGDRVLNGEPAYRFGDVALRLALADKRAAERVAEMGA